MPFPNTTEITKGGNALWRSEARRLLPWERMRVQGRNQGTRLSAFDRNNARVPILNPFHNMDIKMNGMPD